MLFICCQSNSAVENLKPRTEEMKKQINNIYEILDFLPMKAKRKIYMKAMMMNKRIYNNQTIQQYFIQKPDELQKSG